MTNLLEILAACTAEDPARLAAGMGSYGALKAAVTEAVCEVLRPIQARYAELAEDQAYVRGVLAEGADRVRGRADRPVVRPKALIRTNPCSR